MPSTNAPAAPVAVEARMSTGNPELDQILHGGLMAHRPYLICGPSGTGKTTLALQFLLEGVRRGENCLLVTLEEPPNEIRYNHRAMRPEVDQVFVFDAIPDVMRYERTPFKDIAAVRDSMRLGEVSLEIRKTPELSSVEVTFTALEQTLKMETARRHYTRLVIDSLTALQFFCMKGVDEVVGAQTFLRFLSDLRLTTILTVELPLEDVETAERLLARGEIHLFRWENEGHSVRAIGVEKLRGSHHDTRLHPYKITPKGLLINLDLTIARGTGEVIDRPAPEEALIREHALPPEIAASAALAPSLVAPFDETVPLLLALVQGLRASQRPVGTVVQKIETAREAILDNHPEVVPRLLEEARDMAVRLGREDTRADGTVLPSRSAPLESWLSKAPALGTAVGPASADRMRIELPRMVDELTARPSVVPATAKSEPLTLVEPPRPPATPLESVAASRMPGAPAPAGASPSLAAVVGASPASTPASTSPLPPTAAATPPAPPTSERAASSPAGPAAPPLTVPVPAPMRAPPPPPPPPPQDAAGAHRVRIASAPVTRSKGWLSRSPPPPPPAPGRLPSVYVPPVPPRATTSPGPPPLPDPPPPVPAIPASPTAPPRESVPLKPPLQALPPALAAAPPPSPKSEVAVPAPPLVLASVAAPATPVVEAPVATSAPPEVRHPVAAPSPTVEEPKVPHEAPRLAEKPAEPRPPEPVRAAPRPSPVASATPAELSPLPKATAPDSPAAADLKSPTVAVKKRKRAPAARVQKPAPASEPPPTLPPSPILPPVPTIPSGMSAPEEPGPPMAPSPAPPKPRRRAPRKKKTTEGTPSDGTTEPSSAPSDEPPRSGDPT